MRKACVTWIGLALKRGNAKQSLRREKRVIISTIGVREGISLEWWKKFALKIAILS